MPEAFVDSLAKEYGKKNGCYSISMDKKASKQQIHKKQICQSRQKSLNNNR